MTSRTVIAEKAAIAAAVLFLAAYFWHYWSGSLRAQFSADDLMNCHRAYFRPWSALLLDNVIFFRDTPVYRPFPALLYKAFFSTSGFDLYAFRVLVLAAAAVNVGLAGVVAYQLSGRREVGLLAALLFAWHANYAPMLYNTGQIYDVFCFLFYFAALACFFKGRQTGRSYVGPVVALTALALNSKEMAVSLPVMILLWELLERRPEWGLVSVMRWMIRDARTGLVAGLGVALFLLERMRGPDSLTQVSAYQPRISLANYLKQAGYYLGDVAYQTVEVGPVAAGAILLALLALAVAARSRILAWSWALFVVGLLPLAFIPPRGLAAAVIPFAGLTLYGAVLLDRLGRALASQRVCKPPLLRGISGFAMFGLAATLLMLAHPRADGFYQAMLEGEYARIRAARHQLQAMYPNLAPGARLLFASDPFGDTYDIVFLVHLTYRTDRIVVDQLWRLKPPPDLAAYDHVLEWCEGRFVEILRRSERSIAQRRSHCSSQAKASSCIWTLNSWGAS
ncbi:MAG: hypothetical protein RMK57_07185 [Bryobacterales bacterium]|nr:hypothetical protein [Bryobacteraceae bacterium]MDW8354298.1 hypothetical protein [Bryobacterales bacterium]